MRTKNSKPNVRICNKPNCNGWMQPTREFWTCGGKIENPKHRIYKCCECGNKQPWLINPLLDGSFGEFHKLQDGSGFSGLSMLSDKKFYPMKSNRTKHRNR